MVSSRIKKYLYITVCGFLEIFMLPVCLLLAILARLLYHKQKTLFIGMMHVNNWVNVAKAMRQQGYFAKVVPWIIPDHEVDVVPYDVNLKRQFPTLYSNFIGQYILGLCVFVWSIFKFRIFLLTFRSRLLDRTVWLRWLELPLLYLAGKKVVLNTYGGDVATPRLKQMNKLKYSLYNGYATDPNYQGYNEKAIARNTKVLEKQATCIISAIDHLDYLNRVDHYFHLRCIDTENRTPKIQVSNKIPIFIHAPNHRAIKGTDLIVDAIDSINKKGFPCELKVIENTSHEKLMDIIRDADAVIDQVLMGTYARLSIESMSLGKPVFCYLRQDLFEKNTIWHECPIINVNPETLENALMDFLVMKKEDRNMLSQRGLDYVNKYYSLECIGKQLDTIIKGL